MVVEGGANGESSRAAANDQYEASDSQSAASGTLIISNQAERALAEKEAEARVAKLLLETEKIKFETKALKRQISWHGTALEWVKAGSVFAALIGIAVTLYLGQRQTTLAQLAAQTQSEQAEANRAADRFDKALTRMADRENAASRMTGVAGLTLFLTDGSVQHQRDALHYLVTALAEERSSEVQRAILDAFSNSKAFSQEAKDVALQTATELNRSLTATVVRQIKQDRRSKERKLVASFLSKKETDLPLDLNPHFGVNGLTFLQTAQLRSLGSKSIFYDPGIHGSTPPEETAILDTFVTVINALVAAGEKNESKDWTEIYCQKCNFVPAGDLSGAHFDRSFLSNADFSHLNLRGATFRNADLGEAVFLFSDLSNADLSWNRFEGGSAMENAESIRVFNTYPLLECATLYGTNLTDVPLAVLSRQFFGPKDGKANDPFDDLTMPSITSAKIDSTTKLDGLGIRLEFTFDGSYYNALSISDKEAFEKTFESFFIFDWPDPIGDFGSGNAATRTEVSMNDSKLSFIRANVVTQLGEPKEIRDWVARLLKVALNYPIWRTFPLTSKIIAKTESSAGIAAVDTGPKTDQTFDCSRPSALEDKELQVIVRPKS
jgi:hypothetical protein